MTNISEFAPGNMVICVSNEWEDMIVGHVARYEYIDKNSQPMFVVKDIITNQEYITNGIMVHYSSKVLSALCKLDPSERCAVLSRGRIILSDKPEMSDKKLLTYEQYMDKIHQTRLI